MKLSNAELIEEFYESIKEDYPELLKEDVKEIAFTPWQYTRRIMSSGSLESVRLKYFGVFRVLENRAKFMLHNMERKFNAGNLSKEDYEEYSKMIKTYLDEDN